LLKNESSWIADTTISYSDEGHEEQRGILSRAGQRGRKGKGRKKKSIP